MKKDTENKFGILLFGECNVIIFAPGKKYRLFFKV